MKLIEKAQQSIYSKLEKYSGELNSFANKIRVAVGELADTREEMKARPRLFVLIEDPSLPERIIKDRNQALPFDIIFKQVLKLELHHIIGYTLIGVFTDQEIDNVLSAAIKTASASTSHIFKEGN